MRVRFGLVGTAYWAREVHAPGILNADGAELVGVWGRNAGAAQGIAARYGVRAFKHFEDLLAETGAVTMAVAPDVQAELGLRAAEAGRHMILEKPLARTSADADAIEAAMSAHGTAGLVFFLRRFVPEIAAAIAEERTHDWRHATIRVHSAALTSDSPYAASVWRQGAGAAMWDIGPHVLSVLIPMLGPVERITAEPGHDGGSVLHTVHRGGATADISVTLRADPAATSNRYQFASLSREITLPEPDIARPAAFTSAVEALVAMIAAGRRTHDCDVHLAAEITRILAAAEESARLALPAMVAR